MAEERPSKRQKMERSGWVTSPRVREAGLAQDLGLVTEEALRKQKESEVNPAEFSMKEDLKIYQVMGSVAGAGSGEFHTYRHTRRRELDRVARLAAEAEKRQLEQEFQRQRAEAEAEAELARRKRAEKRNKRKHRQEEAKAKAKLAATQIAPNDGSFLARMLALQQEGKLEQLAAPDVPLDVVASEVSQAPVGSRGSSNASSEGGDSPAANGDSRAEPPLVSEEDP